VHLEHGPKDSVRAVKVIDKRTFSPALDLTRELSIMSFLTKVCVFFGLLACCSTSSSVSRSDAW